MSTETLTPSGVEHNLHDAGETKVFGFWVYLMSDCILFACLFATYAVLMNGVADGPSGKDIYELKFVLAETVLLLFSSLTCGMAMIAMNKNQCRYVNGWLFVTFLLGLGFVAMEIYEFHHLIVAGFGPQRSAFLASFFTLVATHGLHVSIGLIWILVMISHIFRRGLTSLNKTRLMCLSLFWHFLDIIWVCVFTVVYLLGVTP